MYDSVQKQEYYKLRLMYIRVFCTYLQSFYSLLGHIRSCMLLESRYCWRLLLAISFWHYVHERKETRLKIMICFEAVIFGNNDKFKRLTEWKNAIPKCIQSDYLTIKMLLPTLHVIMVEIIFTISLTIISPCIYTTTHQFTAFFYNVIMIT